MHPKARIERYVANGLPADEEAALREHLRGCAECRAHYDRERLLARALSGAPNALTERERTLEARLVARAVFPGEANDGRARVDAEARGHRTRLFERLLVAPRRALVAAGVGVAAVLVVVTFVVTSRSASALAAVVTHARGATLASNELAEGSELRASDIITVQPGGVLEAELVRGGTVRVFPRTALSFGPRGEKVALERGKVWCLPEHGRGSFEVTTQTARVQVVGTSFIVDADANKTDVRVVSGTVDVSDTAARATVRLQKDEGTRVTRGQPPAAPRRVTASSDINEWQQFWDELLKALDRGVKALQQQLRGG